MPTVPVSAPILGATSLATGRPSSVGSRIRRAASDLVMVSCRDSEYTSPASDPAGSRPQFPRASPLRVSRMLFDEKHGNSELIGQPPHEVR